MAIPASGVLRCDLRHTLRELLREALDAPFPRREELLEARQAFEAARADVRKNVRARGLGGDVRLETVSGDIDADNAGYRSLDAGSVSGDLNLHGTPAAHANIAVKTMSGDVHLRLPESVPAKLRASTFSGDIRSDFGTVKEPDHGPGSSLDATLGDGSTQVKLETFSGDIEIRKP